MIGRRIVLKPLPNTPWWEKGKFKLLVELDSVEVVKDDQWITTVPPKLTFRGNPAAADTFAGIFITHLDSIEEATWSAVQQAVKQAAREVRRTDAWKAVEIVVTKRPEPAGEAILEELLEIKNAGKRRPRSAKGSRSKSSSSGRGRKKGKR